MLLNSYTFLFGGLSIMESSLRVGVVIGMQQTYHGRYDSIRKAFIHAQKCTHIEKTMHQIWSFIRSTEQMIEQINAITYDRPFFCSCLICIAVSE